MGSDLVLGSAHQWFMTVATAGSTTNINVSRNKHATTKISLPQIELFLRPDDLESCMKDMTYQS